MSHTIIVTGATGFVGSHVLDALCDIDHDQLHIVAACTDRSRLPATFTGEVREGDLSDEDYLARVLTGADIVIHCASHPEFSADAEASRQEFLNPSLKLIDSAIEWRARRFIFISSIQAPPLKHSHEALSPGMITRTWPGLSHRVQIEDHMRENSQRKTSMINLRCGPLAGSGYTDGLLHHLDEQLRGSLRSLIRADHSALALLAGEDISQAVIRAALHPNMPAFESFNIVGPDVPDNRQVIDYICEHYDRRRPALTLPSVIAYPVIMLHEWISKLRSRDPSISRSMYHALRGTRANNIKAAEVLGYDPQIHWHQCIARQLSKDE